MTPERWKQVKAVLDSVLEKADDDRRAFLAGACSGDPELQREIEELLGFEVEADSAFPVTGWGGVEGCGEPADPERVGAYRILRRIGEGGMGIVYLAERDDGEYRRTVAVKVMKWGPGSADLADRFRQERQILARLDHPNIAGFFDAGTTPRGELYYVMEYVEGVPITTYCDQRGLSVRQRLRLFLEIAAAVSYAHRNLIIHRDLKPGNILVKPDGAAKLLDFGLAKVFGGPAKAADMAITAGPIMTPGYASPEQIRGAHLTTATDVYSLGVLLYELLAGKSPYVIEANSPLEVFRAVCEQDPKPPSVVRPRLAKDLDNIVLMALRKEPERRYVSVDELGRDIERFLEGLPVRASAGTLLYRVGKFVRRRRWGVAASGAALAAAGLAAAMIWWQGKQAEMRFHQVRQLAHAVVFELHDAIQDLHGATAARKLLVERALEYLNNLAATGGKDRAILMELASAYLKIGDVQGGVHRASLGDAKGAIESYERARRLVKDALREAPDEQAELLLCDIDERLSSLRFRDGDAAGWRELYLEATGLRRKLAARRPELKDYAALALRNTATLISSEGKQQAAVVAWQETAAAFLEAVKQNPGDSRIRRALGRAYDELANAFQDLGQSAIAMEYYREALRVDEARLAAAPNSRQAKIEVSYDILEIAFLESAAGNYHEAVAAFDRALEMQDELAAADPQDVHARIEAAKLRIASATVYERAGRGEHALRSVLSAIQVIEQALVQDPSNQDYRLHEGWAWATAGDIHLRYAQGSKRFFDPRWREAAAAHERSVNSLRMLNQDGEFSSPVNLRALLAHLARNNAEIRDHIPPKKP